MHECARKKRVFFFFFIIKMEMRSLIGKRRTRTKIEGLGIK